MAEVLPPQLVMADVSQGVITGVSAKLSPQNSVAHSLNMVFDEELGGAIVRPGTSRIGSGALGGSTSVTGLFQFVDSDGGANSKLLATLDTGITYQLDTNTWNNSYSDTAGLKNRFVTFLDTCVKVNGTDVCAGFNGSSWTTSGGALDLSNMPRGKFVGVYKDQVIVMGVSGRPDDMDISSVPNSAGTAVSWTSGNRRIRFNPDDSGNITGHGQVSGLLLVFKDDAMFRWNNRSTEPDRIIDVGCTSHESIAVGGSQLFFFNRKGVWTTRGEYPVLISRRVQDYIDGMDASFYSEVSGYCDGEFYHCFIGNSTVGQRTFSNVELRYTLATKEWAVYSRNKSLTIMARYKSGGDELIVAGDTTSDVIRLEDKTALTDLGGTAISYELESHDQEFGSRARQKEVSGHVFAFGKDLVDAKVLISRDGGDFREIGTAQREINDLKLQDTIRGYFLRFRISGASSTKRGIFRGLELPKITVNGYGF